MDKLEPCPFCGGKAKISVRRTHRSRVVGDILQMFERPSQRCDAEEKYIVQAVCNKCHSRGKPIYSDYVLQQEMNKDKVLQQMVFREWWAKAVDAWNRRTSDA